MSDQTNTTAYPYDYYACAQRLPCGICRLTNSQCPKIGWPYGISYTGTGTPYINRTDITCNTTEGKANE